MADETASCVWCKATMVQGPRLRPRKSATRLCIKCTLWALAGQTPPYVPPRREKIPEGFVRAVQATGASAHPH